MHVCSYSFSQKRNAVAVNGVIPMYNIRIKVSYAINDTKYYKDKRDTIEGRHNDEHLQAMQLDNKHILIVYQFNKCNYCCELYTI